MEYDESKTLCFQYTKEFSDLYATIRKLGVDTGEGIEVSIYGTEE